VVESRSAHGAVSPRIQTFAFLRKTLRKGAFEVRTDSALEQVMRACAAPRAGESGTWIVER